nr:hypothetical protein [Tanacetum cinerariifolium]
MLNKENYVPWSSCLLRYAKSRPNGKLIRNSILNGPYVRKMIPEPGDANRDITVTETFHLQTDDELSDKELKQIEADDQAIQTILLGLPEDIYATVDSCENAQEIWLRTKDLHTADYTQLYDFLKYNQKEVDELKAERLAKTQDPLALMANSNNPYAFPAPHQDQSSFNQNYLQQPMTNPEDITDPTTVMNMELALIAKAFKLNYSTPTNNNQRISSNPRNRQIAQPGQNAGNQAGYNDVIGNQVIQNAVQNLRVQNARAGGNAAGQNGNQIRCYNCKGVEEYDLMAAAADLDEIKEVNANCILMANLQQASTSGTQTDSASVYDTDGSAEVHKNCDNNKIFNMFTQEEQYTELLEPIPESHQVSHNDNDVISEDTGVEQGGATVEQHPVNFEETRVLYESLYQNLAIEVEKVNSVNHKMKETNADMTTELARFKNQERCFERSQEKYDKLERKNQLIYAAVDSCETAQEIWLRVQQMMKGSDIGIQEKKAKLFNEWERFTSNEGESIESYYHRFLKLMNDLKRNKLFPEKIASNLKFLNNLQPEWSRHVTIVHQTKDLHTADYTQLYDFLKYNQKEVDELKAERLAKIQDPLVLMAKSNNLYASPAPHQDQSPFNQNFVQQPMTNPKDITDPTTAMNMALALMAKAFKL